MHGRIIN